MHRKDNQFGKKTVDNGTTYKIFSNEYLSVSKTPSTYPLVKNVLIQSRTLCIKKKLVAIIVKSEYTSIADYFKIPNAQRHEFRNISITDNNTIFLKSLLKILFNLG